jgi:hypothetical protein
MHTEEQAKVLWCPHVRIARREMPEAVVDADLQLVGGCNTDALGGCRVPNSCRCIASNCAAWRWVDPASRYVNGERKGFCGLAGRPIA